jgi:hypothetical protein
MPKLTKKHYKKRSARQKKSKRGRRTKRIYKKMKGGVSLNPVFHAGSLPSNTYYEFNKYEPELQRSPELVDARLLPTMKGGRKTRKSRTHKKHGGSDTTTLETASETEPSTLTRLYRKGHHFFLRDKTAGEKDKEKKICENVRDNYIRIDGYELWDYYHYDKTTQDRENSFLKDIVFYRHTFSPGCDLEELGTLSTDEEHEPRHYFPQRGNRVDRFGWGEPTLERGLLHFSNKKKFIEAFIKTAHTDGGDLNAQYRLFYIKKDTIKEENFNEKDREAFNKMKVDQQSDPYLDVVNPDNPNKRFYNINNNYETWFVRSRLYGIVPEKDEYEIMKDSYRKQGLESKPKFKKG